MSSPALAELHHLRRLGFRHVPILDGDGALQLVYLARLWRGRREVVLVHSEHRARAYRIRPDAGRRQPAARRPGRDRAPDPACRRGERGARAAVRTNQLTIRSGR